MICLKHIRDRNSKISVNGKIYSIDADGLCNMDDSAAEKVLSCSAILWEEVKKADPPKKKEKEVVTVEIPIPEKKEELKLENLDRKGLIKVANGLGVKVEKNDSKLKITSAIKAAQRGKK